MVENNEELFVTLGYELIKAKVQIEVLKSVIQESTGIDDARFDELFEEKYDAISKKTFMNIMKLTEEEYQETAAAHEGE
ncbi:hypothetical protein NQZ71_13225 [Niallia taxi]|uniref:hypothetical protein n=1 Tax=Niallia taxi TaxID=2499688 RepID=UPI002934C682|nr:hypothetical protein [Niallia taxi]WOD61777.1 hypothetical protein NQZ71_13225 [Niallia taxi]